MDFFGLPIHFPVSNGMKNQGFTLIEILLSVAIITIISGISVPLYFSVVGKNNIDVVSQEIIESAHRAQILSRANEHNDIWGIRVSSGTLTLFNGASYASRNSSLDEITEFSPSIEVSGTNEFTFQKFTGIPSTSSTITLTNSQNDTRTISINGVGTIE